MKNLSEIAKAAGVTQNTAKEVIETYLAFIQDTLESGEDYRLGKLGTLRVTERSARTTVNPQNRSEKLNIPGHFTVTFKSYAEFKESLNESLLD